MVICCVVHILTCCNISLVISILLLVICLVIQLSIMSYMIQIQRVRLHYIAAC